MSDREWIMMVLVGLTAAGFLLQGIALFMIAGRVKEAAARSQKAIQDTERKVAELAVHASGLLESLKPVAAVARTISGNVEEIMAMARRRTAEIDAFLEEVTATLKSQADKLDYVVSDTVQKFEETTATIQRDVLAPATEISSVIKGIRTGVGYLFSRKADRGATAVPQEDEMFI